MILSTWLTGEASAGPTLRFSANVAEIYRSTPCDSTSPGNA